MSLDTQKLFLQEVSAYSLFFIFCRSMNISTKDYIAKLNNLCHLTECCLVVVVQENVFVCVLLILGNLRK